MKIKKLIAPIFIGVFLFTGAFYTYSAKAAVVGDTQITQSTTKTFADQTNVALDKKWTVTFSSEVDESSIGNNIKVVDAAGNAVSVTVKLGANKKTVEIAAPTAGYEAGKTYSITIGKGITSTTGKNLSEEAKMNFTTTTLNPTDAAFLKQFSSDLQGVEPKVTNANEENVVVLMVNSLNNYLNNPSQALDVQAAKNAYHGLTSDEQSELKNILRANISFSELYKAYTMLSN